MSAAGRIVCTLNNCIVYFNSAPNDGNYDASSALNYCCTTPLPTNGVGNLSADPQLASASHLSAESPCIGAGSATYASGTDIDGDAWNNPPSIGCDEYHAGAVTGPLTVGLTASLARSDRLARGFNGVDRGPDRPERVGLRRWFRAGQRALYFTRLDGAGGLPRGVVGLQRQLSGRGERDA